MTANLVFMSTLSVLLLAPTVLKAQTATVELKFAPATSEPGTVMFDAIGAGPDGKIYLGSSCDPGHTAHLFRYDPRTGHVADLADVQKIIGESDPKLARHTKVHTQLVFDKRGNLWFATASAEREAFDPARFPRGYRGGHLISYNTKTARFTDHGILLPQATDVPKDFWELGEAFISLAIDAERDRLYLLTYPNAYFVVYDIPTRRHKVIGRTSHWPPAYVHLTTPRDLRVAAEGKVYTFSAEGQLLCYDPDADKLPWLKPGKDYRGIFLKPDIHNSTGLRWLPQFIPGSDGVKENRPFALALDPTRTRIYGLGDANDGNSGLFELVVEPGKAPVLNSLGATVLKRAKGWQANACAITTGRDSDFYYTARDPAKKVHLLRYDLKARELDDLGIAIFPGHDTSGSLITHGATVGQDGTIYFGGEVPDVPHLGFLIYKPQRSRK